MGCSASCRGSLLLLQAEKESKTQRVANNNFVFMVVSFMFSNIIIICPINRVIGKFCINSPAKIFAFNII